MPSERTQHFGLNRFRGDGNISDEGFKFSDKDRDILDSLLWAILGHDHSEDNVISDPVPGPQGSLTLTVSPTGGTLEAGADRFYTYSFIDADGNETFSAVESVAAIPDPITPLEAPVLVASDSGGTLAAGTYKYAVGAYQTSGTSTLRTTASVFTTVAHLAGSTNSTAVTLGELPQDATGWDVWRQAPGDSAFYHIQAIAAVNEVQSLYNNSTTGTFTITFGGQTTAALDYDATAEDVEAALEALSTVDDVQVTGAGTVGDPWLITFLNFQNVAEITTTDGGMDGSSTIATDTPGSTLSWTDAGETADTALVRPSANNTNSTNSVAIALPAADLPLNDQIAGWRIYRTSRSGSYASNSLLATVSDTVTTGGSILIDTYTDVGGGLVGGVPLSQSVIPRAVPTIGNKPALTFYLSGGGALVAGTYARVTMRGDFNLRRLEAFFRDAPDGDASNHVSIRVTNLTGTDAVQEVWNDATGGTFTLTFDEEVTGAISYTASASVVKTALVALTALTSGDLTVTGTGTEVDPWVITFIGALAEQPVALMTADDTNLTGQVLGTTISMATEGRTVQEFDLDCVGTDDFYTADPDYWTVSLPEDFQDAEDADTLSGGTVVSDPLAHGGEAYRITGAGQHARWSVGNLPVGTYVFRFVFSQGATNLTMNCKVVDEDTSTDLYDVNVNPGMSSIYWRRETGLIEITNATNDISLQMNGISAGIYSLDSFEYEGQRPDPILFLDGDDVRVQAVITGSPTDAGDEVNLAIW